MRRTRPKSVARVLRYEEQDENHADEGDQSPRHHERIEGMQGDAGARPKGVDQFESDDVPIPAAGSLRPLTEATASP